MPVKLIDDDIRTGWIRTSPHASADDDATDEGGTDDDATDDVVDESDGGSDDDATDA